MTRLLLASTSPARAAMLAAAGVAVDIEGANVDEDAVRRGLVAAGVSPDGIADSLAETKAVKLSRRYPTRLVLGADQLLVAADGTLHDKPGDRGRAAAQLRALAGAEHRLIAAAVIAEGGTAVWRAADTARLMMRPLSDAFIADYLERETEAVLDCVGCYRIEGLGAQLFARVRGDPFTIQGLPLLDVLDYLRIRGVIAG